MFVLRLILFVFLPVAAVSVPKKKRKMKDLNKKEAVGDLLDAFKEVCGCRNAFVHSFPCFYSLFNEPTVTKSVDTGDDRNLSLNSLYNSNLLLNLTVQ